MLSNLFSRAIEHAIAGFETLDLRGGGRTEAPKVRCSTGRAIESREFHVANDVGPSMSFAFQL